MSKKLVGGDNPTVGNDPFYIPTFCNVSFNTQEQNLVLFEVLYSCVHFVLGDFAFLLKRF